MPLPPKLTYPNEKTLFSLGAFFSAIVWLLVIVGTLGLGLIYVALFGGGVLIAHAVFLASVKGNGIRIGPNQLPELYARCEAAAKKLRLEQMPEIYLLQSGGVLNAFATKLLSRKFVIIYSSLVDGCSDPRQLDFVIGHELGHFAAGHLAWNAFLLPFKVLPWAGPAYSRACEYTCDRCGHFVVGELEPSMRALVVLAGGGRFTGEVSLDSFLAQREETGRFWMATYELVASHPYLCKRVAALKEVAEPGTLKPVPRNPLAYPLAPMLGMGGATGSLAIVMIVVAWIGIAAAIAIPNIMKFQERARLQMLQQQARIAAQQRAADRAIQDPDAQDAQPAWGQNDSP